MVGWRDTCPSCGEEWYRDGSERVNYHRLSDLTLECSTCGNITNIKDDR